MSVSLLWMLIAVAGFAISTDAAEDSLSESEAIARIEKLGGKVIDGRPRSATVQYVPIPVAVTPYWAIVTPLILLSAYLLLSKPRPAKANNTSTPASASDGGRGATGATP